MLLIQVNLPVALFLLAVINGAVKAVPWSGDTTKDKSCGKECDSDCHELPTTYACGTNRASYANRCVLECDACKAKDGNKFDHEGECAYTEAEMDEHEKKYPGYKFDRENQRKLREQKEQRDREQGKQ